MIKRNANTSDRLISLAHYHLQKKVRMDFDVLFLSQNKLLFLSFTHHLQNKKKGILFLNTFIKFFIMKLVGLL